MKRILSICIIYVVSIVLLTGCENNGGGTPPVVNIAGTEIIVGEDTLSALRQAEAGIHMNDAGFLPAGTWLQNNVTVELDGVRQAYVYLYNPSKSEKPYSGCTIYQVSIRMYGLGSSVWAENNTVNGIIFNGMNDESVREAMSDIKLDLEYSDGTLSYKDGVYQYTFKFDDDGLLEELTVAYEIPKSFR